MHRIYVQFSGDFASQSHTCIHTLYMSSKKHGFSIQQRKKEKKNIDIYRHTHAHKHTLSAWAELIFTRVRWDGPFRLRTQGCV